MNEFNEIYSSKHIINENSFDFFVHMDLQLFSSIQLYYYVIKLVSYLQCPSEIALNVFLLVSSWL